MEILACATKGGLGNRLRSLASSMWIAKHLDVVLEIYWPRYCMMGAPYLSIFQSTDVLVSESSQRDNAVLHFKEKYPTKTIKTWGNHILKPDALQDVDIVVYNRWSWCYIPGHRHERLRQRYGQILRNLQWHPYILSEADIFGKRWSIEHCIGIHVRRGDVVKPEWKERFIKESQYHDILKQQRDPIFLATDDPEVIRNFQREYGPCVHSYPCREFHRKSTEAIQDAAIEMHLLSKCKQIISGPSSFSEVAQYMGDKPRIELHSEV